MSISGHGSIVFQRHHHLGPEPAVLHAYLPTRAVLPSQEGEEVGVEALVARGKLKRLLLKMEWRVNWEYILYLIGSFSSYRRYV